MDYNDIRRLVKLVESSGIDELEVEIEGTRVRIGKHTAAQTSGQSMIQPFYYPQLPSLPATAPSTPSQGVVAETTPTPSKAPPKGIEVSSPMVGTFYRAPSPEAPPYVQIGDRVKPGQVLCIIEAMKLMNEIEAEVSGKIAEIFIENAQPVEFGQALFRIEPD